MNIREDGVFDFWTVEVLLPNGGKSNKKHWGPVGSYFIAQVPSELRYKKNKSHAMLEPYYSYGACGKVWQETGNDGFETFEEAVKLMQHVALFNQGYEFRVVNVHLTAKRVMVAKMKMENGELV